MSDKTKIVHETVLDEDTVQWLAESQQEVGFPVERQKTVRKRVLDRIAADSASPTPSLYTIKADEGEWINVAPNMEKKMLQEDLQAGVQSYLLRLAPGFEMEAHEHRLDEECLVLEGSLSLGPVELSAGDFHFAPSGIGHGVARSEHGALIFIRGATRTHYPARA